MELDFSSVAEMLEQERVAIRKYVALKQGGSPVNPDILLLRSDQQSLRMGGEPLRGKISRLKRLTAAATDVALREALSAKLQYMASRMFTTMTDDGLSWATLREHRARTGAVVASIIDRARAKPDQCGKGHVAIGQLADGLDCMTSGQAQKATAQAHSQAELPQATLHASGATMTSVGNTIAGVATRSQDADAIRIEGLMDLSPKPVYEVMSPHADYSNRPLPRMPPIRLDIYDVKV